jgi:hypothetical protein
MGDVGAQTWWEKRDPCGVEQYLWIFSVVAAFYWGRTVFMDFSVVAAFY